MFRFPSISLRGALVAFVGFVGLANAAAVPRDEPLSESSLRSFIAGLPLSSSDATEAITALKAEASTLNITSARLSIPTEKTRAVLACHIARLVFDGKGQYIDMSSGGTFVNATEVNWSQTCWLSPQCFVTPTKASEVGLALKIVTFLQARFAVRAGGHNPNSGFASVSDYGLLIDLSGLNQLSLSADKKILSVGPGNRWKTVYNYLVPKGVSVIGGRVPEVGVGGYMLGGGLAHFTPRYGLACDNVANFEVVLSDSSIINANAKENPELFFALKGGGPNYGIVTRFDLNTVQYNPSNQVWYEVNVYAASENDNLLRAMVDYQAAAAKDPNAGITFSVSPNFTSVGFIYSQPTPRPDVFKSFYSIPSIQTYAPSTIGTPEQLALIFTSAGPPAKYDIVAHSAGISIELYQQVYARYVEISSKVFAATGIVMTFVIQPITKNAVLQGQQKGGNPLGLAAQDQSWFAGTATWTDDADTAAAHQAIQELGEALKGLAQANGVYLPIIFQNDANYDQSPLGSFPAANLAKLKAASLKYDRSQAFQRLQNSGFKLSKA